MKACFLPLSKIWVSDNLPIGLETTYKMFPDYTRMIEHMNGGDVIHQEFRAGNMAQAVHNIPFVQQCIKCNGLKKIERYTILELTRYHIGQCYLSAVMPIRSLM